MSRELYAQIFDLDEAWFVFSPGNAIILNDLPIYDC